MLNIKPFRQSTGMCGPASLKMVLGFFGIEKSEEELARLMESSVEHGTKAENLIRTAEQFGFKGEINDLSDFSDIKKWLDKNIPVIVDWFSQDEGHFSVVVDLDDKFIYLRDLEKDEINKLPVSDFKRVWFDFPGDFITSKNDLIIRRIIAIYK